MPKDRINELHQARLQQYLSDHRGHEIQDGLRDSVIPFTTNNMDDGHSVAEFLAQIKCVRILIDKIEELSKDVERIHTDMFQPMADLELGQEADDKTTNIKKLASDVFKNLKNMQRALEAESDQVKDTGQWRMKASQIFDITHRFNEAMNQHNLNFVIHRERCKKSFKRELEMTGNKMTDDEVEEIIQTGFPGTFSCPLMVDIKQARQAANQVEARHRDITKLEESIVELREMFADLIRLVATQGEMVDKIHVSVITTEIDVKEAEVNIGFAVTNQTCARKRTCCIVIIIVAIVLVLILIAISYLAITKNIIGR